jgi:hypothetical protein
MEERESAKLEYLMSCMNLLQICLQRRYTVSVYNKLKKEFLSVSNLKEYLENCKNNLDWRCIFLEFLDVLHIDHLNHLLNPEENLYYDFLPYTIEGFVDEEYNEVMLVIKGEVTRVLEWFMGDGNVHYEQAR